MFKVSLVVELDLSTDPATIKDVSVLWLNGNPAYKSSYATLSEVEAPSRVEGQLAMKGVLENEKDLAWAHEYPGVQRFFGYFDFNDTLREWRNRKHEGRSKSTGPFALLAETYGRSVTEALLAMQGLIEKTHDLAWVREYDPVKRFLKENLVPSPPTVLRASMRYWDEELAEELRAKPWMKGCLDLNPGYVSWGPHEDYMVTTGSGWSSRVLLDAWEDFNFGLNDLNEVVNFYFSVSRDSTKCQTCEASGYHPDARWVTDSFYGYNSPFSLDYHGHSSITPLYKVQAKYESKEFQAFVKEMMVVARKQPPEGWRDKITQSEVDVLVEAGRLRVWRDGQWHQEPRIAEVVNENQRSQRPTFSNDQHDGINRHILIEERLQRYGIPIHCPKCEGTGFLYTAEESRLVLTLWVLHPRKGCSRGVEINQIRQEQLPEVFAYLKEAAERNQHRFQAVVDAANRLLKVSYL